MERSDETMQRWSVRQRGGRRAYPALSHVAALTPPVRPSTPRLPRPLLLQVPNVSLVAWPAGEKENGSGLDAASMDAILARVLNGA